MGGTDKGNIVPIFNKLKVTKENPAQAKKLNPKVPSASTALPIGVNPGRQLPGETSHVVGSSRTYTGFKHTQSTRECPEARQLQEGPTATERDRRKGRTVYQILPQCTSLPHTLGAG